MQLPNNTVPSESNFLAPFFPGAGLSSADAETLTTVRAPADAAKFDQLFDGLRPAPKPTAAQPSAELVNLGIVACPMPFVAGAPVDESIAAAQTDLEETDVSMEEEGSAAGGLPRSSDGSTAKAAGHTMRDSRISPKVAKTPVDTDGSENVEQGMPPDVSPTRSQPTHPVNVPNAHAAEAAFQTPRFTGLPENAIEHRQASTLPPGLTRLMAIHSPAPVTSEIATESSGTGVAASGAEETAVALPSDEQVRTFGSRPTNWPGASGRNHTNSFPTPQSDGRQNVDSVEPTMPELNVIPADQNLGRGLGLALHQRAVSRVDEQPASVEDPATKVERGELAATHVSDVLNRVASKRDLPGTSQMSAKIAETLQRRADRGDIGSDKQFVRAEGEHVASGRKHVGTDVAKPAADMFSRFLPTSAQPSAPAHAGSVVAALEIVPDVALRDETVPVETVSTAHEAVEVVLKAVDHASSQEQKSVNLRFSVGELDLSVRVELHADQVRTTFRTDSTELRAALSQEWEAVAATNPGERTLKMVPAFVTASEHSALNSFSGDTSSRQRDQRAEREANERSVRVISKSRGAVNATPVASSNAGIAPLTSRRLYTVA